MINIAIDGPGGAGKSSVAKCLAKKLGFIYVDTGALYRALGLYMLRNNISIDDTISVIKVLPTITLSLKFKDARQIVLLNGEDVGDYIRTPEVSMAASKVSAIPEVRAFLLDTQRHIAKTNSVIMDGRDIGTVILPNADLKIFLIASPEARAKRRLEELKAKGIDTTFDAVLSEMNERDNNDSTRASAPLKQADDAILLDNSELTLEQTADRILLELDKKKRLKKVHKTYNRVKKIFGGTILFFNKVHITGLENVPQKNGYMVCCNHIAAKDVFILGAALPHQIRFIAKKELFAIPVIGQLIRAAGAIKIDRGGKDVGAVRSAIDHIKMGETVAIFPQGHRHPGVPPKGTPTKNGAGLIAFRSGCDVLPVFIDVRGNKYGLFKKVTLKIGKIIPHGNFDFQVGGSQEYDKATKIIWNNVLALDEKTESVK